MRKTTYYLLGLSIATALAGTAFAVSPDGPSERWQKADTNGNNVIEKSEFMAGANQKFTEMDSNGDGVASQEERRMVREIRREERAQRKFGRLDMNSDGNISENEFNVMRAERKARREQHRDINDDGVVDETDRDEFLAGRADRRAERQERRQERRGTERFNPDANGDELIDFGEHAAAAEQMFSRMDENGDGVLTKDELRNGKRHGKRKRHRMRR